MMVRSSKKRDHTRQVMPDKQSRRFIEKARELGCDEDEAAFEKKLKKLANAKPPPKSRKSDNK